MEAAAPFTDGRAGGARQGPRDLQAGVLRLPRRGRQRRTRARIGERAADRSAARRLAAWSGRRTTSSRCCCTASPVRSMARTYPDAMISMGMQSDEWIAAIGSYRAQCLRQSLRVDFSRPMSRACARPPRRGRRRGIPPRWLRPCRAWAALDRGSCPPATTRRRRATPRRCGPGAPDTRRLLGCGCRSSCRSRR